MLLVELRAALIYLSLSLAYDKYGTILYLRSDFGKVVNWA